MKRLAFAVMSLWFCAQLLAQTNVLYGTVGNYGLAGQTNVKCTLDLVYPNPRVVDGIAVRRDPQDTYSLSNGMFYYTNIAWGVYNLTLSGKRQTTFGLQVYTNTTGYVNIGSLVTNDPAYPPDPATNYYSMSQVDALLADVVAGTSGNAITNGDTRDLVLGGTSNYIRGILSAGDVVLNGGGGVLDWNGGEVDATLFVGGTYVGDIFHGSAANLTNIQASNIVGLVSSTGATVDAGSVPAEERLRFPIGNGLYARATVHPNALWLPTNWNGAQIWLAFTGSTNQSATAFGTDTEDPFVYSSNDGGNTWTLKSAAPLLSKGDSQTIAQWSSSGWQADPELYLDTNGVMRLLWMGYHPYSGSFSNVLFHSQSTDGTNWSTPTVLRKWASNAGNAWSTNAAMAGPQIVSTPQGLRLYYVDDGNYGTNASGVGTNSIWYVSALDGSGTNWNWASAARCTLSPYLTNNSAPWHFDIALVGSNRWYLQYGSQASSFGEYATSTNGVNWSAPGMGLFLSTDLKQRPEEYGYYKSTWSAVPGANVPTFNAILGHTPLTQANVEGWNFSLVRGLVPDPLGLVYTGANTNRMLIGGNSLYSGVGNIGAFTVIGKKSDSASAAVVTIGQPFSGWGGVAAGANAPMDATNYILASDGLTETRLNARGSGVVNLSVNNSVKATVTSSNASFVVPLYANGVGVSNVMAETLVNAANVTNLSVWGSGVAEGTRLWFMDEQLAYAGGSWYFTGGVDFSGAEVEGLVGITSSSSSTPLAARGIAGQTANLFEVQDADSNVLVSVSPSGRITGDGNGLDLSSGMTVIGFTNGGQILCVGDGLGIGMPYGKSYIGDSTSSGNGTELEVDDRDGFARINALATGGLWIYPQGVLSGFTTNALSIMAADSTTIMSGIASNGTFFGDGSGLTGNLTNVTAIGASGNATIGGGLLLPAASSDVVAGGVGRFGSGLSVSNATTFRLPGQNEPWSIYYTNSATIPRLAVNSNGIVTIGYPIGSQPVGASYLLQINGYGYAATSWSTSGDFNGVGASSKLSFAGNFGAVTWPTVSLTADAAGTLKLNYATNSLLVPGTITASNLVVSSGYIMRSNALPTLASIGASSLWMGYYTNKLMYIWTDAATNGTYSLTPP